MDLRGEIMENKIYSKNNNRKVIIANDIIQKGKFSLSAKELKIIFYIISQIKPNDCELREYEIDLIEFCKTCGINKGGTQAKELEQALLKLEQPWVIRNEREVYSLAWSRGFYVSPITNKLVITLDEKLKPYLIQLKNHFTAWELIYTLHFKSKYTIRLYILLKSIHYQENSIYEREYTVQELKSLLDADNYIEYRDFHSRALKPAIAEINKFSDKFVSYEPIKNGKSVIYIKLTISTKDSKQCSKIIKDIEKNLGISRKPSIIKSKMINIDTETQQTVLKEIKTKTKQTISDIFIQAIGRKPDNAFIKIMGRRHKQENLTLDTIRMITDLSKKARNPEAYILSLTQPSTIEQINQKQTQSNQTDENKPLEEWEVEWLLEIIEDDKANGRPYNQEKIDEYKKMLEEFSQKRIEKQITDMLVNS